MTGYKKVITEGKTKVVLGSSDRTEVLIESKSDITAGDGAKRDLVAGKDRFATSTTCNCFELLRRQGIPTHYVDKLSPNTFRALRVDMAPLEIVARRVAFGSYLKRNPTIESGTRFADLVVELFLKDDHRGDPFLVHDTMGDRWFLYEAKRPMADGFIGEMNKIESRAGAVIGTQQIWQMKELLIRTFLALEIAWARQDVVLVDLKIECGYPMVFAGEDNQLVVADVIDNDSWRIWPGGVAAEMLDKEVYRDLAEVTPEALGAIKGNYAKVAEMTGRF